MNYYITLLFVYLVVYALSAWSLNLQFGQGGIVNFAYILFQSAGAYAAAITSLGPAAAGVALGQTYFWGTSLPFPLPFLIGGLAGGLLALIIGPATLRKMRKDYQAAAMLVAAIIANQVVTNAKGFLNGAAGLVNITEPLVSHIPVSSGTYSWIYVAWSLLVCGIGYWFVRRIGQSPFGRSLRAIRDDEDAASGVGKNAWSMRMTAFIIGGIVAGLSGALLIEFIGAWSPAGWGYQESFVILVAVILGGIGSERGSFVGAFLVGIVLTQLPSLLPSIGYPGLIDSLEWVLLGVVWLAVLWIRPGGIVRERPDLRLSEVGTWSPWHRPHTTLANLPTPHTNKRLNMTSVEETDVATKSDQEELL